MVESSRSSLYTETYSKDDEEEKKDETGIVDIKNDTHREINLRVEDSSYPITVNQSIMANLEQPESSR